MRGIKKAATDYADFTDLVLTCLLYTSFGNIYAEGYPREESRQQTEAEILDLDMELAHYRRYSDPRYYKGVEYADTLEALARRRAAELFAANGISPNSLFVNVQPLSGAPANKMCIRDRYCTVPGCEP